ncbi:uncharacterized protein SAPINGB_P003072 [Magnusiomyces paraingens]|uniref:U3 small nucleolar ribonucleoprotein protein MPP10 n=1 Tax=Magnusiomyces paraingens TaxID=2606893 RepID=A0A5E8BI58_9ASCO|nr:uncharacterized protein SAPINGB_P003072 [Saprochaete ingens]VVT51366.1 unnamed protein product [Saprochaete ingens]
MPVSKNRKTEKSIGDLELLEVLKSRPYDLLIPSETLKKQSLDSIKKSLDPIASHYSIFDEVHLEGLDVEQVWAQAQMIVEGVLDKVVAEEVPQLIDEGVVKRSSFKSAEMTESEEDDEEEDDDDQQISENDESEDGINSEEDSEQEENDDFELKKENVPHGEDDSDFDIDMEHDDYQESDMELESEKENDNDKDNSKTKDEIEEEESGEEGDEDNEAAKELNDDFFKLDAFQKQIEALEKDNEEDDEDIDYFADLSTKDHGKEEDDGLDALKYEDFFAPPKKKRAFNDKNRKKPDTRKSAKKPSTQKEEEFFGFDLDADEKEYEKAMGSIRKDLFEEEDDDEEENGNKTKEILSTLEQQQRDIRNQIEKFEQENVASKSWELSGEAKAKDRPANSLLEADLDFERSRKPAPVITQEITETLEDLIKKRIKKNDFDDIPRRLPDTLPEFRPSKLADVQETKSKKSLGELYEEDYLKQTDPDAYAAQQNEQLDAVHQEIVNMFTGLSRKLDSLSAWHYTPKAPTPSISIVAEAPAISMEDAQPTALSTDATLAPQEVFKASEAKMNNLEVIGRDGLPISRSEMSREDKKKLRRKIKARKSKVFKEKEEKQKSLAQKKGSKADVMETLKKANVTVIDKKGQKRDLSGKLKDTGKSIKPTELRL